jgi:uncharacterized membrane protein YkvA (DUF1232 family)
VECGRTVGALASTLTRPGSQQRRLRSGYTLVDFGPTAYLKLLFCSPEVKYGCVEYSSRSELPGARANNNSGFLDRIQAFAGRLPFVEDLVAAYYCALDPATPMRVRGVLLAALVYFIFRWRYRPLTLLWRGLAFTDDAAVLTAVFGLASHIKPVHRAAAARALGRDITKTGE